MNDSGAGPAVRGAASGVAQGAVAAEAAASEAAATAEQPRPRVLVVFATKHGSTMEVAQTVAEELRDAGVAADVASTAGGADPSGYHAVVVAAPMIMGWHKEAVRFLRRNRRQLSSVPTAYFVTAASLTKTGEDAVRDVPVDLDPWLAKAPKRADKLSRKERYATPEHYAGGILKKTRPVRPRCIAFFAGSLDMTKMNIFEQLFVMLIVGASPGDGRHWQAIRDWAASLPALLAADEA